MQAGLLRDYRRSALDLLSPFLHHLHSSFACRPVVAFVLALWHALRSPEFSCSLVRANKVDADSSRIIADISMLLSSTFERTVLISVNPWFKSSVVGLIGICRELSCLVVVSTYGFVRFFELQPCCAAGTTGPLVTRARCVLILQVLPVACSWRTFLAVSPLLAVSCWFHETYISVLSSPSLLAHTDVAVMPDNGADEKVVLPVAFIASCKFGEDGEMGTAAVDVGIPEGSMGLDCGPETIKLNAATIAANKTIIWNGCI